MNDKKSSFVWAPKILLPSFGKALTEMADPIVQLRNPVVFSTLLSASLVLLEIYLHPEVRDLILDLQLAFWMISIVYFSNFSRALAENQGKAEIEHFQLKREQKPAKKVEGDKISFVPSYLLRQGDVILCESGDFILADGEVIAGVATVDESAITGESDPVIRESGGDRSGVTAGTKVVSDSIKIQVSRDSGNSFLESVNLLFEGTKRVRGPNELGLTTLFAAVTILFLFTSASAFFFVLRDSKEPLPPITPFLTLFVCIIPTTAAALRGAMTIGAIRRLIEKNMIIKSSQFIESGADIDLLILDKTGTITIGNRHAVSFVPVNNSSVDHFAEVALLASIDDMTPEGRSISQFAKMKMEQEMLPIPKKNYRTVPFTERSRLSGVDFFDDRGLMIRSIRKGSVDAIRKIVITFPPEIEAITASIAKKGSSPILVVENGSIIGAIELKDNLKRDLKSRFVSLRKIGIHTIMVTGDNPLTAAFIAAETGLDDYIAEATPEIKLELIKREQAKGKKVAMIGDGNNDAPALAQADVAVAMGNGTQAAKEAATMIALDNDPTKILDLIEIGRELLMTRGALLLFSLTSALCLLLHLLNALFYPQITIQPENGILLLLLDFLRLSSQENTLLSSAIFNALIILFLLPLALRGISYRHESVSKLLHKNLILFGLGGFFVPLFAIKLIDIIIQLLAGNYL